MYYFIAAIVQECNLMQVGNFQILVLYNKNEDNYKFLNDWPMMCP